MPEPLPIVPPAPDFDRVATVEHGPPSDLSPRLNAAQRTARRRAQLELSRARPDQYVVYLDIWTGDSLERRVLIATDGLAECHRLMDELPSDVRGRTAVTHTPAVDAGASQPKSGCCSAEVRAEDFDMYFVRKS